MSLSKIHVMQIALYDPQSCVVWVARPSTVNYVLVVWCSNQ